MNETKQQDLTRMLGVWLKQIGSVAVVNLSNADSGRDLYGPCLDGGEAWDYDGKAYGPDDSDCPDDLTEKLGDLDDLRRGADVLMRNRCYPLAMVAYQLLGDEEGVERAVAKRREEIERERQADGDKPPY